MPSNPADLMRAAFFAAQRHSQQKRKGAQGEPYVNHLLEVSALLAQATGGQDIDLLIAALLHDTIEDVGVTREEIEQQFGREVAGLVMEVTDNKQLPKAERKALQVQSAPHKSERARMIKIADKTSNLRALVSSPPTDWSLERKAEYFRWAASVVAGCRGVNPELEAEFDRAYEAGAQALGV